MEQECTHNTHYPTDISDAEWDILQPYVDKREHLGAPRTVCLRCILNALFYKNKTGCQWSMLPHAYPHRSTVYWYLKKWTDNGTWTQTSYCGGYVRIITPRSYHRCLSARRT